MFDFSDQVVVVTGGTRGIGAAITTQFIECGATVHATYGSNDIAANHFKESLGDRANKLHLHRFDVSNQDQCRQFFEKLSGTQIHVLVNNSGIRKDNLALQMSEADWDSVLNINLKGSFLMTKFAAENMLSYRYGRIINISSIGGQLGLPGQANYAASKAGQVAISKSIGKEVAKRGITINNVAPGFIDTELLHDLPEDLVKEYKKQIPMKRFGKPSEVAHAVCFLASKDASYITGSTIEISGGL